MTLRDLSTFYYSVFRREHKTNKSIRMPGTIYIALAPFTLHHLGCPGCAPLFLLLPVLKKTCYESLHRFLDFFR